MEPPVAPAVEFVGNLAGVLTTVAFLPQVVRAWRTRSTADLSAAMLLSFVIGVALWLVYGLAIDSAALVWSNVATLLLAGALLGMKWRHARRARHVSPS